MSDYERCNGCGRVLEWCRCPAPPFRGTAYLVFRPIILSELEHVPDFELEDEDD